jgi:hypothetical protein
LQRHHLAREVFLSQQRDSDTMDAILRRAHVLSPRDFGSGAACSGLGEDVFVCEYLYDSAWRVRQAGGGCVLLIGAVKALWLCWLWGCIGALAARPCRVRQGERESVRCRCCAVL